MAVGGRVRAAVGEERLLLLGVSVRALAQSVARSRLASRLFRGGVVAIDYFGDADLLRLARSGPIEGLSLRRDLRRSRSLPALCRAALGLDWDAFACAGGLENRPGLLRRLQDRGRVLGNGAAAVQGVRDPARLFPFLRQAGIPHAMTWTRGRRPPAGTVTLWKPLRSGGGRGVRPAAATDPWPRGHYRQELLRGRVGSIAFVADGSRAVILGVSEQIVGCADLGAGGFRYAGSIAGPIAEMLPREALPLLAQAATAITGRFGLAGLNGLDFVLHTDVPRIIEVNPRYTASMELFEERSGASLFDLHVRALAGGPLPDGPPPDGPPPPRPPGTNPVAPGRTAPDRDPGRFLAKGILYADRPLRAGDPEELLALGCRDVPVRGERFGAGQPVCTLMARGGSPGECRAALATLAQSVRRRLHSPQTLRPQDLPARQGTW